MAQLTLRQQNESDYYDTFSKNYDLGHEIDLSIIDNQKQGLETRDWNSYWAFFKQVVNAYSEGSRLLDFGCGAGHDAVRFAHAGYDVCGFDISEGNCNAARHFASRYELSDKINISVETAEALSYEDGFFDVVAGVDVLHHVDIPNAIRETYRVLKPGGVAFFREPVEIPVFDTIRNTRLVKHFFPNSKSFDQHTHITEDERKLNKEDLSIIKATFPDAQISRFDALAKFYRLAPWMSLADVQKIDHQFIRLIPGMHHFGGGMILTLSKPK